MTKAPEPPASGVPHHRVAIIGTGFAGLGMAVRLKRAGLDDIVLLERADEIGGTWRDNTYPGAACDVPSHLYSFSFAPNPGWSRSFSPQPEIWDYLLRVAKDEDVVRHVRFGHELLAAHWEPDANRWRLETSGGTLTAQFLVSGTGPLSDPSIPDIPGLERFAGTVFHSARWDHDHDLRGRDVAVIGTGASAIQFVPRIQPLVRRLHLFQRTPPWIIPRHDRPISGIEQRLYRALPVTQRIARTSIYWARENYVFGFAKNPRLTKAAEALARFHLRRQVKDPWLRAKLTPDYTIGCKRILMSNDYYPALTRPNASVVTEGIAEIREHSIITRDGAEHDVDTIIFGTGFHVTDIPVAQRVHDAAGVALGERWGEDAQAFRGTTINGYPNFFLLTGPNTGLGHTSQVFMIEAQIAYVMAALRYACRNRLDRIEVRADAQDAYNTWVQNALEGTVWTSGGCDSWYLNSEGRNTTLWPTFTWSYALRTRRFDPANYLLRRETPASRTAVAA
ncbi:flavin-containing monooxygenase [Marinactinospora thermotolerans]|uniref:Predicted flavoprotein CzcO associated with the cation diffusion facilitator CzcD n=1 Tax=Marinactinospora thermotolerans DSM 45154 TaxID=1122192 RepID=A0A1T4RTV5_9ACTN|nr:NAD(P)/FAD-dependent oxidoreductase [Marinactinospora thermotolerans]SKA19424.1 Predicted flavoprotein CzcO associated with the cation diffusion facilitator CzcD [Marinactinospora thermotolerans DSM 45154]